MKDRQGRGWFERHREKAFESGFHEEIQDELKKVINENGNVEALKKFVSRASLIKSLIPQLLLGILLFVYFVETVEIILKIGRKPVPLRAIEFFRHICVSSMADIPIWRWEFLSLY